jgi:branched-chain amino acid transport system ATP-binding protein
VTPVLRTRGLAVSFGGVHALAGVDLEVNDGRLVGLIGPNGAGKTTLVDAITGFVGYQGEVELDGRELAGVPAHVRAKLGLVRTWQGTELFDDLTVRENVTVAAYRPSLLASVRELFTRPRPSPPSVDQALELLGIAPLADAMPADLSQGQRKLVGVARALGEHTRVLCLDEPAAGLDTEESQQLGRELRQVADAGTAMLLIDHDMGLVLGICDDVYVLEFGKLIAHGPPEAVRSDPAVIKAYLGSAAGEIAPDA